MSVGPAGGSGQWARARNEQGAKSFLDELAGQAGMRTEELQRSLAARRRIRRKIAGLLHLRHG